MWIDVKWCQQPGYHAFLDWSWYLSGGLWLVACLTRRSSLQNHLEDVGALITGLSNEQVRLECDSSMWCCESWSRNLLGLCWVLSDMASKDIIHLNMWPLRQFNGSIADWRWDAGRADLAGLWIALWGADFSFAVLQKRLFDYSIL